MVTVIKKSGGSGLLGEVGVFQYLAYFQEGFLPLPQGSPGNQITIIAVPGVHCPVFNQPEEKVRVVSCQGAGLFQREPIRGKRPGNKATSAAQAAQEGKP